MKRSSSLAFCVVVALALLGERSSWAETRDRGDVDVSLRDAPPPHRTLVVQWNPVSLLAVDRLSIDLILAPKDHHAVVLNLFYAQTTTEPIATFSDSGSATQLPAQRFRGFGGELGYRYYASKGGPRGFFAGPSFLLGSFSARAQDGDETAYLQIGAAADIGYQMLVADCVSLSFGGGVQVLATSKSIPDQQFPAWIYANDRVSPRVLLSLGWAF